uniref:uncharacterized protein K02A2.6-like n=1 Tax=Styela clava TaxID=7725 RepID=UPI001939FDCB|nr:uncharacterized protein K02A2.6-like [Styela clava]
MQHCPGKWHKAPDALSRNPTALEITDTKNAVMDIARNDPSSDEVTTTEQCEARVHAIQQSVINSINDDDALVTLDHIRSHGKSDKSYNILIKTIENGFPNTRHGTPPEIRDYWGVRDRLSTKDNVILMDSRIVIPTPLRKTILRSLHSAHQGITGMKARANQSVYWPGMNAMIRNFRFGCLTCTKYAPSQTKEPMISSPAPQYPFQHICADYFVLGNHCYLSVVDRFSGWISIFHYPPHRSITKELINSCRGLFTSYGAPEEFDSDGGPQFTSSEFQNFLTDWGIKHRKSSASYPQSNGRAELGVKTAKRIIRDSTSPDGSLNNNKAAQAILQYRNTPLQNIDLSPAQILLHRQLRDHVPTNPQHYGPHPQWIISAGEREQKLANRHHIIIDKYNNTSRQLPPLSVGTTVVIQSQVPNKPRHWNRTGRIVEILPYRQYKIRVDGSGRVTIQTDDLYDLASSFNLRRSCHSHQQFPPAEREMKTLETLGVIMQELLKTLRWKYNQVIM